MLKLGCGLAGIILAVSLATIAVCLIVMGVSYNKLVDENTRLYARNRALKARLTTAYDEVYRSRFKVPEVDNDKD